MLPSFVKWLTVAAPHLMDILGLDLALLAASETVLALFGNQCRLRFVLCCGVGCGK
jgi:hypothetical protein